MKAGHSSVRRRAAEGGSRPSVDPRFEDRERQPGLDLLRAIAIIVVIIYHAGIMGFPTPGRVHRWGWIGVDLFFVLSGYLIGGQLLGALVREKRIDLGRFFARRGLRIMPAYLVVLAIYIFLPSWREYPDMYPWWKFVISVQNIGLHGGTAFSHAWSLAVEDQFYLTLPFILLLLNNRPRAAFILPCVIFAGGVLLRAFLALQFPAEVEGVSFRDFQAWIYYPTWTRLDPLVCGVALAAIEKFRPQWWSRLTSSAIWIWLPGLGLIVYALWLGEGDYLEVASAVSQFSLLAVGFSALLICAVSPRSILRRIKIPGVAFIASISYSAYLIQKLAIHGFEQFCLSRNVEPSSAVGLIGVELSVYIAATILFFAVERPFLQLRKRIAPRR
ncbi:MAG TPA: acyltransferase [Chthoniobacterales bacterium]|nr:acyltransferase [Chthoniobacterales bacterium]